MTHSIVSTNIIFFKQYFTAMERMGIEVQLSASLLSLDVFRTFFWLFAMNFCQAMRDFYDLNHFSVVKWKVNGVFVSLWHILLNFSKLTHLVRANILIRAYGDGLYILQLHWNISNLKFLRITSIELNFLWTICKKKSHISQKKSLVLFQFRKNLKITQNHICLPRIQTF